MKDSLVRHKARLQIIVLIHPNSGYKPFFEQTIYSDYTRDFTNPLFRGLGIPVFFWNPFETNSLSIESLVESSLHTFVVAFVDSKMVNDKKWGSFLETLLIVIQSNENHQFIPVNVDGKGHKISKEISKINFIRYDKFPKEQRAFLLRISLTNEICRMLNRKGLTEKSRTSEPIKLFLNHSKKTGEDYVEKLRDYVLKNTSLNTFFDVHDIPPGRDFEEIIYANIEKSCLLAFITDDYSSREWCRKEILKAKESNCPIVVIDCLENYDERLFPYIGNTPIIRWNEKLDMIDILSIAAQETLKNLYKQIHLEYVSEIIGQVKNTYHLFRAPELLTCINIVPHLANSKKHFLLYPDPPLGIEELSILVNSFSQLSFTTPTQFLSYQESLEMKKGSSIIGLSIADSFDLPINGLSKHHLIDTFVEFSRYILATQANLAYGGDLREHGFTNILFDLTRIHSRTNVEQKNRVINFLAWPFHKALTEEEQANLNDIADIRKTDLPEDLEKYNEYEPDSNTEFGRYLFARSLSKMRKEADDVVDCRVILGGKRENFRGKYPGLVEEAYLAISNKKPIYIIGAFGGSAYDLGKALSGIKAGVFMDNSLSEKEKNFIDYYNHQIDSLNEQKIDYKKIFESLMSTGFEGLNNGLTKEENDLLLSSIYIFEIISLVLKGLKKIELI